MKKLLLILMTVAVSFAATSQNADFKNISKKAKTPASSFAPQFWDKQSKTLPNFTTEFFAGRQNAPADFPV
ncbi:MAG: hypothetical protein LBN23_01680, partial [Paludibacter sp.]|nr:hypothetical protein [Paludibacter sp.]